MESGVNGLHVLLEDILVVASCLMSEDPEAASALSPSLATKRANLPTSEASPLPYLQHVRDAYQCSARSVSTKRMA